jgi:hypothetical protein
MFLIRLKTVGNCIVTDLKDTNNNSLILYSGNDRIIDLEQEFTLDQIKRSMRHPDGDLKQLMDNNIIEKVNVNSNEYKKQLREQSKKDLEKRCDNKVADKHSLDEIIRLLVSLDEKDSREVLQYKYFDNLSVLDRVLTGQEFCKNTRVLAKELMDEYLNTDIDKKFVLI